MPQRIPKHRHRVDGRGVVTLAGVEHYTGKFGTEAAERKYRSLVGRHLAGEPVNVAGEVTVAELCQAFIDWTKSRNENKKHKRQAIERVERSLGVVLELNGTDPVNLFGPVALAAVRAAMIRRRWTRQHVQTCIGVVRRCWSWGVSRQIVKPETLLALRTLEPLGENEHGVKESQPRFDVPWETVRKTLRHLTTNCRAMVLMLWHTGARPDEIYSMRPADVDRRSTCWVYRPVYHKCKWRRQGREILLGRIAQRILRRYMDRPADAFCFDPRESHRSKSRKPRYSDTSLRWALRRACKSAGVESFAPYQLRHAFATRVSAAMGQDVARRLLGQKSLQTTARYDHMELGEMAKALTG